MWFPEKENEVTTSDQSLELLREKYGRKTVDSAQRLGLFDFPRTLERRGEIDQHFTKAWAEFTYNVLDRKVLDDRTLFLVLIGECTVLGETEELETHVRSAIANGVAPREVLEIILRACIYVGNPRAMRAERVFMRIVSELGRLDELKQSQLPLEGKDPDRTIDEDRPTWKVSDEQFPRREELMAKYGWRSIGTGLRLQPTHFVQWLQFLDRIDQHYLKLWLDSLVAGIYTRQVVDDRTQWLVMTGECAALGELEQAENHMRCALLLGATPRQVQEVLLLTTLYAGMPTGLKAVRRFAQILEEEGRLDEITETQLPLPVLG